MRSFSGASTAYQSAPLQQPTPTSQETKETIHEATMNQKTSQSMAPAWIRPFFRLLLGSMIHFAAVPVATGDDAASQVEPAAPTARVREIALEMANGLMLLPTEINGNQCLMMVDTGAMSTVFSPDFAKLLNVSLKQGPVGLAVSGISGAKAETQVGEITGVVDGLSKREFPLSGTFNFGKLPKFGNTASGRPVVGVIGSPELARGSAVLDCRKKRMMLHPGDAYAGPSGWKRLKLTQLGPRTDGESPLFFWLVEAEINGNPCLMVVDTGAQATVLTNSQFAKDAGIELRESGAQAEGFGEQQVLKSGLISSLMLDGQLQLGKFLAVSTEIRIGSGVGPSAGGESLPIVGILGMDQLERMEALFDCRRGALFVPATEIPPMDADVEALNFALVSTAMNKLAAVGDPEASALKKSAEEHMGRLNVTPQQCAALIKRAKERGLLKDEDRK